MVLLIVIGLVAAPRSDVLTAIEIDAPPASVWSVLADTDHYSAWNPMISSLRGPLVKGAAIEVTDGYGRDRITFRPTVLAADKDRALGWRGRLWGLPCVLVVKHEFLMRATPRGTLFTQEERFRGALLWVFDPHALVPAVEAMNVALAGRAEAAVRRAKARDRPSG